MDEALTSGTTVSSGAENRDGSTRRFLEIVLGLCVSISMIVGAASTAKTEDRISLQLKWYHQSQFAGYYTAIRKGFFARARLKVELIEGGPNIDPVQQVVEGKADIGISDPVELILARSSGAPVVILTTIFQNQPNVFVSRRDLNIKRPSDLRNKVLRVNKDSTILALLTLLHMGLRPGEYRTIDAPSKVELMRHGAIDAWFSYLSNMPVKAKAANLPVNIVFPTDYNVHIPGDTIFTTERFARANPELLNKLMGAAKTGWRYAVGHVKEAAAITADVKPGLVPETEMTKLMSIVPLVLNRSGKVGCICRDAYQDMIDKMTKFGFLNQPIDVTALIHSVPTTEKTQ